MLSILCEECDSRLHRVGGRGNHHLLPAYADGAGVESIGADDASRDFRATRRQSCRPCRRSRLAELRSLCREKPRPRKASDLEDRFTRRRFGQDFDIV